MRGGHLRMEKSRKPIIKNTLKTHKISRIQLKTSVLYHHLVQHTVLKVKKLKITSKRKKKLLKKLKANITSIKENSLIITPRSKTSKTSQRQMLKATPKRLEPQCRTCLTTLLLIQLVTKTLSNSRSMILRQMPRI